MAASDISFNNSGTGMSATNTQNAITELNSNKAASNAPIFTGKLNHSALASTNQQIINVSQHDNTSRIMYIGNPTNIEDIQFESKNNIETLSNIKSKNDKIQINIHDGGLESVDFGYNFNNHTGALFYANSTPLNGSFGCVSTDGTNHYTLVGDSSGKLFWNNVRIDASLFKDPYSHTGGIYWRQFTSDFANLNNINITGYGAVQQYDSNYPSTNDGWGDLISFINGPDLGIQIYFGWNDGIYYIRHKYNNNWTSWKKISVT